MAVKDTPKTIAILLVLGVCLLAYGLGAIYVAQRISRLNAAVSILGAAALLICFLRVRSLMPKSHAVSRWKRVALFVVLIALWTVLLVEVNFFSVKRNIRWDLTRAKQHTLTKTTEELISDLGREIRMTALHVGIPPKYLEDLLREFERVSNGKITTEIIDPIVEIGYAAQFGSVIEGDKKVVFVQTGNEQRQVDFTDEALTEEQLMNAVARVIRPRRNAYFLIGHNEYNIYEDGEQGLKVFDAMLATNNVIGQRLMLGITDAIPEDCDLLIVAGPKSHFSEREETLIQEYLEAGGDALFLIENVIVTTPDNPLTEAQKNLNPSLNGIFELWGIEVADDVVVDLTSHASGDVGSPATQNYLSHKAIVGDLDYTFFVRPRSISFRKDRRKSLLLAPIIMTASAENSWGETNRMLKVKYDEGVDRSGPVPIAFAVAELKQEGDKSDTRIVVITDADFLTNAFIAQYSNARLGINAVNWLTEADYRAIVNKPDVDVERLDLTSAQKRSVGLVLVLMPIGIAVIGTIVWIKQQMS